MQGLHISSVQEFALELLLISEERIKAKDFTERFKLAVVGADPQMWVAKMFPDWIKNEPERIEQDQITDEDLDDSSGEWIFTETVTQEEVARTLAEMTANRGVTLDWKDLPEQGADEGWS